MRSPVGNYELKVDIIILINSIYYSISSIFKLNPPKCEEIGTRANRIFWFIFILGNNFLWNDWSIFEPGLKVRARAMYLIDGY